MNINPKIRLATLFVAALTVSSAHAQCVRFPTNGPTTGGAPPSPSGPPPTIDGAPPTGGGAAIPDISSDTCVPIAPPTLFTSAIPSGDCATIPGTSIQAGAGCQACANRPALRNPHDPADYGGSLAAALAAGGDVYFAHPGTYTISSDVWVPQGVTIECAPGVTLIYPVVGDGHTHAAFFLQGSDGVYGCDFQGANQTGLNGAGSDNFGTYLIWIEGAGNRIECNTFEHAVGNAAVGTFPGPTLTSNAQVDFEWNTCSGDPLYCFVLDAQSSGSTAAHNLGIDSSIGSEWDGCPTNAGGSGTIGSGITITQNIVTTRQGNCASLGQSGCVAPEIAGEAYPDGCNYSGETVTANYVGGSSPGYIGMGDNSNSAYVANVHGNYLGPNAACRLGSGC